MGNNPTKSRGKRLSVQDWDDVADLCEQGATACEIGYEEHTVAARDKAAKWMHALSMKAHIKARTLEVK
jgi:hypothetical protein